MKSIDLFVETSDCFVVDHSKLNLSMVYNHLSYNYVAVELYNFPLASELKVVVCNFLKVIHNFVGSISEKCTPFYQPIKFNQFSTANRYLVTLFR